MFGLSERERICADVLLFAYTYIAFADPVITRGGWEHITRFKPATFFVPYLRERPFNLKGGGYGFFLKKYSDSQCC